MLMRSSSDDEGFLDADETRRDLRPRPSPASVLNKSETQIVPPPPSAEGHKGTLRSECFANDGGFFDEPAWISGKLEAEVGS